MESLVLTVLSKEVYLLGLIAVLMIGGLLREGGYFAQFYGWVRNTFASRKGILLIMSAVGGILPVEGRCSVSAPFLDSIVEKNGEGRKKMGIIDYIATHHYYLWSPLEPAVLIFLSVLGMSYAAFLQVTLLPLIVYIAFLLLLVKFYVSEYDIVLHEPEVRDVPLKLWPIATMTLGTILATLFLPFWYTFPVLALCLALYTKTGIGKLLSFVNWGLVVIVGVIIAIGTYLKTFSGDLMDILTNVDGDYLYVLLPLAFLAAFVMGSSSKYAGLGAAIIAATNIKLLPLVLITEFCGYLLSPVHKCLGICKMYFSTRLTAMYGILLMLCGCLLGAGVLTYFTLLP